jgi:hypothetical protein
MHLRMCTWSSGGRGFYAISVNYLRYFYGLFTLFALKNKTTIYGLRPRRRLVVGPKFD